MSKKPKWEKCPLCNGTGKVDFNPKADTWPAHIVSTGPYTCPHCHGARIINRKTGRPALMPQPLKAGKGITMDPDIFGTSQEGQPKNQWDEVRKEAQDYLAKYERKPGESPIQYRKDPLEGLTPFMTIRPEWRSSLIKIPSTFPLRFYINQVTAENIVNIADYLKDIGVKYEIINGSDNEEDPASGCHMTLLQLDIGISPHCWRHFIKGDWIIIQPSGPDMALYQLTDSQYQERFKP